MLPHWLLRVGKVNHVPVSGRALGGIEFMGRKGSCCNPRLAAIFALSYLLKRAFRFAQWIWEYHHRLNRALKDVGRVNTANGQREGDGLWLAQPIIGPVVRCRDPHIGPPRILVVANLKGGVGGLTARCNPPRLRGFWNEMKGSDITWARVVVAIMVAVQSLHRQE
jgi:hypothetical protein